MLLRLIGNSAGSPSIRRRAGVCGSPVRSTISETSLCTRHAAMRAMDGLCALGHRVPDHGLILGCRRAWRSEKHVKNGLIATPGGSVSRPPDTIPSLLRIDAAAVG